jgi:hypothetical protein
VRLLDAAKRPSTPSRAATTAAIVRAARPTDNTTRAAAIRLWRRTHTQLIVGQRRPSNASVTWRRSVPPYGGRATKHSVSGAFCFSLTACSSLGRGGGGERYGVAGIASGQTATTERTSGAKVVLQAAVIPKDWFWFGHGSRSQGSAAAGD